MSQQSAWIRAQGADLTIEDNAIPTPGSGEVLVKVTAIAFTPLEAKIQKAAIVPMPYPNILGMSFSGIVENVGPDVTKVKAGDRVSVIRTRMTLADSRFGGFQQYALAAEGVTSKLSDAVSIQDSAASIINLASIASAFSIVMGLDRPSLTGPAKSNGKKFLIYGGSSPAGALGVSYAVAAGYEVVTTSSPSNKAYVESLKPVAILDHTSATIFDDVASHGLYDHIFDAVGVPESVAVVAGYVKSIGGGKYYSFLPGENLPEGVQVQAQPYSFELDEKVNEGFRDWFYNELVATGLGRTIVPTRAQWLEGGLADAQKALDLMWEHKVSSRKLLTNPNA